MKKMATRLLYVFSFSLLFTALYLNFSPKNNAETSFLKPEKKENLSAATQAESGAVAQPENNTAKK